MQNTDPMTERTLHDLLFPFSARLHVELTDEYQDLDIQKFDPRMMQEVKRLLGVSIFDLNNAHLSVQERAIRRSREAVRALYRADEMLQLDKRKAIDYAYGWVIAQDTFLTDLTTCTASVVEGGCQQEKCPSDERIAAAAVRASRIYDCTHPIEFEKGFCDCVNEKIGMQSGRCILAFAAR